MPFLTPDMPPDNEFIVRRLLLPADVKWTAIFDGMLLDLCYQHNWEADGTMSPADMAQWFLDRYAEFTTDFSETPYSDGADELGGEPKLPWYENLYDWIIAGFLAITFTPLAAITYQATVPKLRVAFRTGDIGALFRVLINGIEVWTGDSYGPIVDIIDKVFDTSGLEVPYTVRIEHSGKGENVVGDVAKLEYIRNEAVAQMIQTILRADPGGCGIQWSQDNGGNWETIDLATCIGSIADERIQKAIDDGRVSTPSQPGATGETAPGVCHTYDVTLAANDIWTAPFGLSAGDTIEISRVSGLWSDAGIIPVWQCIDGRAFLVNVCTSDVPGLETDPLPEVNHMRLIASIDGEFIDIIDAGYTIPVGKTDVPFMLQANDSPISDNVGSANFRVVICKTGWVHTFDFTTGMQEFTPHTSLGHDRAIWVDGSGWEAGTVFNGLVQLHGPVVTATLGAVQVFTTLPGGGPTHDISIGYAAESAGESDTTGQQVFMFTFASRTADDLFVNYAWDSATPGERYDGYISKIIVYGTGTDPF